jgi:ribokinase
MGLRTIVVIGTINYDTTLIVERVPDPGESVKARGYRQSYGGKGANAAISSFRSCHLKPSSVNGELNGTRSSRYAKANPESDDVHVRLVAATGDDENGRMCRENLQNNGIDISGVRVVKNGMTGMSFCVVEEDTGENRIMSHRGANDSHEPQHFASLESIAGGLKPDLLIFHLTLPLPVVYQILETAGEAGIDILLNAAPAQNIARKVYRYLTHLIVNETEAAILKGCDVQDVTPETCRDIAEVFLKKGAKNVVITLGKMGAYYATKDEEGEIDGDLVPAQVVNVVDTTGAG